MRAVELANSTIELFCQSAHRGCAGIDRQLHPLKVKDLMKTGVVKFKRENVMLSYAYKSISLKLAKSTVLLLGKYQYNEGALELVVNCIP